MWKKTINTKAEKGKIVSSSAISMESSEQFRTPPRRPPSSPKAPPAGSGNTASAAAAAPASPQQQRTANGARGSAYLDEAAAVLEAMGGQSQLDGFNLLGVVANPRGPNASMSSSYHGGGQAGSPSAAAASAAVAANAVSSSSSSTPTTDNTYYQALEMTLSQVTEQVEALNSVLEDWSRQILEDPYPSQEDQVPESMLTELPVELRNLNLQSLQEYLEASGVKAHGFQQRKQRPFGYNYNGSSDAQRHREVGAAASADDGEGNGEETAAEAADRAAAATCAEVEEEIPPRFFRTDFDLTDPETFRELLLIAKPPPDGEGGEEGTLLPGASSSAAAPSDKDAANLMTSPVHEWFPLPPQDTFGGFLDRVELALLLQVRSKSGAFFEESLRFAQLQEMIRTLLGQVIAGQDVLGRIDHDLVEPAQTIPESDAQRADLRGLLDVLELADEMLQCRSGIGGLLSSQDDLTAIQQIQYGRNLLSGQPSEQTNGSSTDQDGIGASAASNSSRSGGGGGVELRRLHALRSVWDQLNQYELLVVTNLREELVEIFLGWNTAVVSSIYGVNVNGAATSASSTSKCSPQVQQRVREIVGALRQCHALPETRDAYSNRLQEVIRMTVRTTVGEFASDSTSSSSLSAAGAGDGNIIPAVTVSTGATAMTLDRFLDCLDMLFEQLLALLTSASGVDEFCMTEHFSFEEGKPAATGASEAPGPMTSVVTSAAELSSKSISELLRLRKEAHSLVTLVEMKRIWDKCLTFASQVEELSSHKASALRSTLLAQAKAFVERKHESNMSALVAALDSERWTQCEVSTERQVAVTRLCSGRSIASPTSRDGAEDPSVAAGSAAQNKSPEVEVDGKRYKVVWSCLLVVEMVINDIAAATHFPSLASSIISKVSELFRLFNSRTTQLVLGAGAIHSAARLKSINAKHLSLVTQCLGMVTAIFPHVRAGLMLQLPQKQHTLLFSLDQIKREFADHSEKVLNKFVTIIGGIVEHGLAPKINGTDFDARAKLQPSADGNLSCCIFLEGVSTNTRKMHQVLASLLPPDHLQDVFSRIFAFVDKTVPTLFLTAAAEAPSSAMNDPNRPGQGGRAKPKFSFPKTDEGKRRLLLEVEQMTKNLNGLEGVYPWDFTATMVLGKELEYQLAAAEDGESTSEVNQSPEEETGAEDEKPPACEQKPAETAAVGGDEVVEPASGEVVAEEGTKPVSLAVVEAQSETGSEVTGDTGIMTEETPIGEQSGSPESSSSLPPTATTNGEEVNAPHGSGDPDDAPAADINNTKNPSDSDGDEKEGDEAQHSAGLGGAVEPAPPAEDGAKGEGSGGGAA